jgi:hypothetical protein
MFVPHVSSVVIISCEAFAGAAFHFAVNLFINLPRVSALMAISILGVKEGFPTFQAFMGPLCGRIVLLFVPPGAVSKSATMHRGERAYVKSHSRS